MQKEFTPTGENVKIQEQKLFENVWISFVVNGDGKMFEKITEGKYLI